MRWWQRGRSTAAATHTDAQMQSTCSKGQQAEDRALAYLQAQGLRLLARNYRTPGRGGGEIDLILQDADGTVVFVEVRSRSHTGFGGAGGSIGHAKRQRLIHAAQCWLQAQGSAAACRFDVVLLDAGQLQWIASAFEAD